MAVLIKRVNIVMLGILLVPPLLMTLYTVYIFSDMEHLRNDQEELGYSSRYYTSRGIVYFRYDIGGFRLNPELKRVKNANVDTVECLPEPRSVYVESLACKYKVKDGKNIYNRGILE